MDMPWSSALELAFAMKSMTGRSGEPYMTESSSKIWMMEMTSNAHIVPGSGTAMRMCVPFRVSGPIAGLPNMIAVADDGRLGGCRKSDGLLYNDMVGLFANVGL